ncbi:hypothetical protein HAX54_018098 [Datura stramonium]|uniref:Myb-like domain-containing protein n=1 Tax=Datura stramonium TaxID=4076 RepID=A0ABS8ULW7_DATST|nr:hypothetical protein [Datura stramonium]
MALQNAQQSKDMNLVLSSDAKPRLKWTPDLHQRFVSAVTQLGGPEKYAKIIDKEVMNIHGLTLYHLKSHLQKYRLGKSQVTDENKQEGKDDDDYDDDDDTKENEISRGLNQRTYFDAEFRELPQSDQLSIGWGYAGRHSHLPVFKPVQRRSATLQLGIEAQGKYLQSVLRKAQETLAGYAITETDGSISKHTETKKLKGGILCSLESSLTSSESSARKEDRNNTRNNTKNSTTSNESLIESETKGGKRCRNNISDDMCVEQPSAKRFLETIDLNNKCPNEYDENGPKVIDLN